MTGHDRTSYHPIFWLVVHLYCKIHATIYKFCPHLTRPLMPFCKGMLGREKIIQECKKFKFTRGRVNFVKAPPDLKETRQCKYWLLLF